MKILKVTIRKQRDAKTCHFTYPERWDTQKIHMLAYEDHPKNLGKVKENCLCVTDDETANWLLEQAEAEEINIAEANLLGRRWRGAGSIITDENTVITILRKLLLKADVRTALKKCLTQQEIDSLDENTAESGINKRKEFDIEDFI